MGVTRPDLHSPLPLPGRVKSKSVHLFVSMKDAYSPGGPVAGSTGCEVLCWQSQCFGPGQCS
jgi:hypothetical protein